MKRTFTFILIVAALFAACSSGKKNLPEDFDFGTVENNVYKNAFFNFEITIPNGWHVQSQEEAKQLMQIGVDAIAGENRSLRRTLKASEVNSANLLTSFKYDVDAPVSFNPSIIIMGENLNNFPGIKTGKDYWFHTRNLLLQSGMYSEIDENGEWIKLSGQDFYVANAYIEFPLFSMKQTLYSAIVNHFAIAVIISHKYGDKESETELMNSIKSLTFSN